MSADAASTTKEATSTAPAVIVHHLNDSRSQRILWLLEELEVPYEIKFYQRGKDLLAPKELRDVHPLGKSPVITDTDGNVIAESGAIVAYIIKKYGNGKAQPPAFGEIDDLYFAHYAEGSLMPLLVPKYIFSLILGRSPWFLRWLLRGVFDNVSARLIEPQLKQHLALIEAHLAKSGDWFAGGDAPTSADYMMAFAIELVVARAPESLGTKMKEFIKRVQDRPAYKRGVDKGGEYGYGNVASKL